MSTSLFLNLTLAGLLGAAGLALPPQLGAGAAPLAPARPPLAQQPADTLNPLKIVFFGSSVPFGQGATNKYGYVARYAALLGRRATAGQGAAWTVANISVPGDNTTKVAARWPRDLAPQRGRYVVLALSLGNEGIHGGGQPIFEQFKTNLAQLVQRARAQGLVPVVANCYTRNDYTPEDYAFIKQMNLLLHAWAVPSINLLGAVDDGAGHWAPGYWDDALHPNDAGHAELAHAIVPSLFDALRAGKALPRRQPTAGVRLGSGGPGAASLVLRPEALLHPFTQVVSFRTAGTGQLVGLQDSTASGSLSIAPGGGLAYTSARGGRLATPQRVNDNRWHQLALAHYYAAGYTALYLDGAEVGRLPERLLTRQLSLGGSRAPRRVQYRNWLFYRAGMNADEARALAADSLLKSSLELYAPLGGRRPHQPDSLRNLAQSTNGLLRLAQPSHAAPLLGRPKRAGAAPR
ncbi:GDSL-type esterase/lipase family protein [Hymenobacter cheonanensis]|uniref:GDSL-type esterase/lipase family protein n=1 Tax=Hymenobacter sp. CA2-7 TaxID=3063993 RepID=UPI00271376EF|nr:GDSL-type esterase/lipase family protein [Hymenobacter sp. CA2-7]MDO7885749.1 GDSL-type esterase/lipase family protein [Hymenobacter sp. CA2-7]